MEKQSLKIKPEWYSLTGVRLSKYTFKASITNNLIKGKISELIINVNLTR